MLVYHSIVSITSIQCSQQDFSICGTRRKMINLLKALIGVAKFLESWQKLVGKR